MAETAKDFTKCKKRYIEVNFGNERCYTYKTFDSTIAEGDQVLVPVKDGCKIGTVTRADFFFNEYAQKWETKIIMARLDLAAYEYATEKEKRGLEDSQASLFESCEEDDLEDEGDLF